MGTLILSYISRFGPFLEVQNFELHFLEGGMGREGQINKYVWGYDEIIFFYVLGSHFYQFGFFYGQSTDLEKNFGVAKFQIFFGYS